MAKNATQKDGKKHIGRQTPRDVQIRGTFEDIRTKKEKTVRKPTPGETRANNISSVEYAKMLTLIVRWMGIFDAELREMNRGKRGRPYLFCDSMILWIITLMTEFGGTFRSAAGMAEGILSNFGYKSPSYSRLFERFCEYTADLINANDSVLMVGVAGNIVSEKRMVGIDSSGFNLSSTLLWRKTKWDDGPKSRGWLKLHALCDVKSGEIIAYAITTDKVGDAPILRRLLKEATDAGHRIGCVYADGAYCSKENHEYVCEEKGILFVTSFRRNTRAKNGGCESWGKAARLWCSLRYEEWVKVTGYGIRWKCECVFSDIKRMLGETLNAHTLVGAVRKLLMKTRVFNEYKKLRFSFIGGTAPAPAEA